MVLVALVNLLPYLLVLSIALCLSILVSYETKISWLRKNVIQDHQWQPNGPRYSKRPYLLGLDYLLENGRNILRHRFADGIRNLHGRLGPTYSTRIALRKIVVTIEAENLKAFMQTRFDDYSIMPARTKLVERLFGRGVFTTDGHDWNWSRHLTSAGMASLDLHPETFERFIYPVIEQIRSVSMENPRANHDFGALALRYTWGISCKMAFGDMDESNSTEQAHFAANFNLMASMAKYLTIFNDQLPWLADVLFWNSFRPAQRQMFDFVDGRAKDAVQEAQYQKPITLIGGIATRTSDIVRIRSETLNLLLAGSDTVRIALCELFYFLARHPTAWLKVRAEVATLDGKCPSHGDLRRLTYLCWCINESLRLRPTLSVHGRLAIRDTILPRGGGILGDRPLCISKGTYVVYSNYALYRSPHVFGPIDVNIFAPERWASVAPKQYEYLNFGAGPRRCPGKRLGWSMMAYAVARLAQEIEFLAPVKGEGKWQEMTAFSFTNRHGHWMHMTPRHATTEAARA